ncbi:SMI1/KNR4 family protein [Streptomyces sp. NPDC001273]|uniref:SMI1/KNR4 family protein n=1 Tax=unclassified Streptomyces TaxID=2593676 RepID=UPI00340F03E4
MNTDHADPAELAAIRDAFEGTGGPAPALGWDAVRAFEAEHGVVLPEPYRTFVAEIANGSASGPPHYGLLPLGRLPDDWDGDAEDRDLSRPFPLTGAWLWEEDEDAPDRIDDGSEDHEGEDGESEDEDERVERVYNDGSIVLGTDGCAMNRHLVVSGPRRGHVWLTSDVGAVPFGAESGHTAGGPGFAGWVRHWAAGGHRPLG